MSIGDTGREGPARHNPTPPTELHLALADQDTEKDVQEIAHGICSFLPGCTAVRPLDVLDLTLRTHPGKPVPRGFVAKLGADIWVGIRPRIRCRILADCFTVGAPFQGKGILINAAG